MNCEKLIQQNHLQGFITEENLDQAEEAFPGIATFYEHCRRKPSTFLDLVWQFGKNLADHDDVLKAGIPLGLTSSPDRVGPIGDTIEPLPIQ